MTYLQELKVFINQALHLVGTVEQGFAPIEEFSNPKLVWGEHQSHHWWLALTDLHCDGLELLNRPLKGDIEDHIVWKKFIATLNIIRFLTICDGPELYECDYH